MGKKKRSSSTGSLKGFILLLLILGSGVYFYQNLPEAKGTTKELSHTLEKAQKEVANSCRKSRRTRRKHNPRPAVSAANWKFPSC